MNLTMMPLLSGSQEAPRPRGKDLPGMAALGFFLLFALVMPASSQDAVNGWAWVGGSDITGPPRCIYGGSCGLPGVYGALGVAADGSIPGARFGAASSTDKGGNLWLFGGDGFDANDVESYLNDLWEFNSAANEWTWVSGSNTVPLDPAIPWLGMPPQGVYGTLGTAAAGNVPGGRESPTSWFDKNGNFWLFGGTSSSSPTGPESFELLNDLWEFNPTTSEWAWMSGSSIAGSYQYQPGVYGTLGVPAAGNVPGGRYGAASWTDSSGNLWLFGGRAAGSGVESIFFNDLWEFNPTTMEWTWMGGSDSISCAGQFCAAKGVYGTLGVPAARNVPGGRTAVANWVDKSGNFWLFGGNGADGDDAWGQLNDLWMFDPSTKEWTWVSGSSTEGPCSVGGACARPGVYGSLGIPAAKNVPGGRYGALSWIDFSGNSWVFGGLGAGAGTTGEDTWGYLNDFWEFNPSTKEWTWMGGNNDVLNLAGSFGTLGSPSAGNVPGGLMQGNSWTDDHSNLWLFGGYGLEFPAPNSPGPGPLFSFLNDTWVYEPLSDVWPLTATPTFTLAGGTYKAAILSVGLSDALVGATIYYTLDGSMPTTNSTVYSSPIEIPSLNTVTVQAVAVGHDHLVSSVASATYQVLPPLASAPVISPPSGKETGSVTITMSDSTPNSVIHFTLDYSTPLPSSPVYTGPITMTDYTSIKAIATAPNYQSSIEARAQYTIVMEAPAPAISPAPGNYAVGQLITLSDADPTATLRYTTDGSTPTTHSNFYSHPFALTGSETVKAIAITTGYAPSATTMAVYTTTAP
jgi:N-acetylneuraminic acid mutarotase